MPENTQKLKKKKLPVHKLKIPKRRTKKHKSKVLVSQSCPTQRDPMDYSSLGSSVQRILQASKLEWVVISFSKHTWAHISQTTESKNKKNLKVGKDI